MARFNSNKKGFGSSFLASLLSGLLVVGALVGSFAVYNHYDSKNEEVTENVEVETDTETETPSEEVVENEDN